MLYAGGMNHSKGRQQLAVRFHRSLLPRVRTYLNGRGIPDAIIDRHLLGWNGRRITIPVPNRHGDITLFRFARDPEDRADGPKMLSEAGRGVELYGWERVLDRTDHLVICSNPASASIPARPREAQRERLPRTALARTPPCR